MDDPLSDFAWVTASSIAEMERHARPDGIYRGHIRSCWLLETSLERCCERHEVPSDARFVIEEELIREFRRAYYRYAAHVPADEAGIEWLSLMQHYGAPTRLLDFTYSIHVAAYFAVERTRSESAVWLLNPEWALEKSTSAFRQANRPDELIEQFQAVTTKQSEVALSALLMAAPPDAVRLVCGVNAFRLNERLQIQKGVFIAPGDVSVSFMENLRAMDGHDQPANILRIKIPASAAKQMRADLFGMNITRRTLFPGLDGYAQALGIYHPVFNPDGALRRRLAKRKDRAV
jgi:FRG domain